ncbi:MAG TPA: protein translocase subunit SecD [Acidimicrobiia bacterium]|nr:protein translocase subunit SecD [Acidimicrobiia bacterium]
MTVVLRVSRWRLFFTVVFLGASIYAMLQLPVRLGLDLRGGTQIVLEAQDTDEVTVDAGVTARTLEVLRRRVDALGVAEPTLQISGDNRIIVELPGVDDPEEAVAAIGRTAQLTFHAVEASYPQGSVPPGEEGLVLPGEPGEELVLGPVAVSGEEVETAIPFFDSQGSAQWVVSLQFRSEGAEQWAELTGEAACAPPGDPVRRIAIVLDDEVISSPGVAGNVSCGIGITGGGTIITGGFTEDEATELAALIQAGALPVPVEVIERGTVGPSLGEAAIDASVEAALIGAGLTLVYMIVFYRLMGVVAALSLGAYALISYAVLVGIGATLTLPGIAGFVLAIGMAVDANVLVYERTKEEHAGGSTIADSIRAGFARAWSAIADSNVTTLLAAVLLFFYATGAVRGFGITLSIGVIVSMFSALVVTRVLLELLSRLFDMDGHPRLMGMTVGQRFQEWIRTARPNILHSWRRWLVVAGVVVVLSLSGLLVSRVEMGLEFAGGRLLEFETEQPIVAEEFRLTLADSGLSRALVQESGEGNLIVRTEELDESEETALIAAVEEAGGETTIVRDNFVGPTFGRELRNRALTALLIAVVIQMIYLAWRFRWTIALASVLAMVHDVALLIGAFAWLGKTLDGVFLAALLTVIGYSVNDSVVIFDRVREQLSLRPDDPIQDIANDACLQTLPRTINTGLGALLILVSLYVLGGDTLGDFALALLIGILAGTYSSVFTATPIAIALENRFPRPPPEPEPKKVPGGRRETARP